MKRIRLSSPIDLPLTLGPLRRGTGDPCMRIRSGEILRATRTPDGPATVLIRSLGSDTVSVESWGSGHEWVLERAARLIGAEDDARPLWHVLETERLPETDLLRDLFRQLSGLRLPRSEAIAETLIPVVLEQRVTGWEARRSYRELTRMFGEPAPGPVSVVDDLLLPPSPARLATIPYWTFHKLGVEMKRAATLVRVAACAKQLDGLAGLAPVEAQVGMRSIQGVGEWSAAEVALIALGDPDAVSVGDYHLPHQVSWAFRRVRRSDDEHMLQLLEPYRGQRGRVLRLIQAAGIGAPRFGPRREISSFRHR